MKDLFVVHALLSRSLSPVFLFPWAGWLSPRRPVQEETYLGVPDLGCIKHRLVAEPKLTTTQNDQHAPNHTGETVPLYGT